MAKGKFLVGCLDKANKEEEVVVEENVEVEPTFKKLVVKKDAPVPALTISMTKKTKNVTVTATPPTTTTPSGRKSLALVTQKLQNLGIIVTEEEPKKPKNKRKLKQENKEKKVATVQ